MTDFHKSTRETNLNCSNLPLPHSGKNTDSFAYTTIKDRLPTILVRVIDTLCRHKDTIRQNMGESGFEDLKKVNGRLSKLRSEVMTDKVLLSLQDGREDAHAWNTFLERMKELHAKPSWYELPWLYIECYMYRRIQESLELSETLQTLDVFRWQKCDAFTSSLASITILASFMHDTLTDININNIPALRRHFEHFLHLDLWGNKCDLSISGGAENSQSDSPLDQVDHLRPHILVDDTWAVWDTLVSARKNKESVLLHVVLDNAGFEIFTDFCLIEFLLQSRLVDRVHFHIKPFPWFVSDVVQYDFTWTLNQLVQSQHPILSLYGKKWKGYLSDKVWTISEHKFWCQHFDFTLLATYAADLHENLSKADLIIFKGDLNYRKLTGDLMWDDTTPFETSLRGFKPAPLCTLRTIKADVIVGLPEDVGSKLAEDDPNWRTGGEWAVIQFSK